MKDRKALKAAYKNKKFKIGVFQIRNKTNNKIFVGSSMDLNAIWNRHRLQLNMGSHPSKALQQDWKTLGSDNFVYEIIEEIKQDDDKKIDYHKEMKIAETLYIEELQPFDEKGYNRKPKH